MTIPPDRDPSEILSTATGCRPQAAPDLTGMASTERRSAPPLRTFPVGSGPPTLDEATRRRLGQQLRALYEPVIDETLDPRLADLLGQLEADRAASRD